MSDPVDFDQSNDYLDSVFQDAPGGPPDKWERPLFSVMALAIVSLGIKSSKDIYFATAAQLVFFLFGKKGPAGMYSALAGIQVGRGQYKFAAFPTLMDSYYTISDLSTEKRVTYSHLIATTIWFLGYFLAKSRYI